MRRIAWVFGVGVLGCSSLGGEELLEARQLHPEQLSPLRYAARAVPIHNEDGVVMGRLHPGAQVVVVGAKGDAVKALVLPFEAHANPMSVFTKGDALVTERPEPVAPKLEGRVGFHWMLDLHPGPVVQDPEGFARIRCTPFFVQEVARVEGELSAVRVAQVIDSVELGGWTHPIGQAHGPHPCPPPIAVETDSKLRVTSRLSTKGKEVAGLPDGFQAVTSPPTDVFQKAMDAEAKLYWQVLEDDGSIACRGWKLDKDEEGEVELVADDTYPDKPWRWYFGVGYRPADAEQRYAAVRLAGPYQRLPSGETGDGWKCMEEHTIVSASATVIELLSVDPEFVDGPKRRLRGFRTDAAQRWFHTEAACMAAREESEKILKSHPMGAMRLGLHPCLQTMEDQIRAKWLDGLPEQ